jgi:hypothetical protein
MAESFLPSPLGRYDPGTDHGKTYEVRLLGVPIELFLATRQQHDELMREFAVMALAHREEDGTIPQDLRDLIRELGVHYAPSATRPDKEIEDAVEAGISNVDLVYHVSESVVVAADELEKLMTSADEFCRSGRMLTMPRSPEMLQFSAWWLQELRHQVSGLPATSWLDSAARGTASNAPPAQAPSQPRSR